MILQKLCELYDRLEKDGKAPSPGFVTQGISFEIVLTPAGDLVQINDLREMKGKKAISRDLRVPVAEKRTSGVSAQALWDNGKYLLGLVGEKDKADRVLACLEACRAKHAEIAAVCDDAGIQSIHSFLAAWNPEDCTKHEVLKEVGAGFGVFRLQNEAGYIHDRPKVLAWWRTQQGATSDAPLVQCLITGRQESLARLHPSIKGVAGAQSSGASIVSFNQRSFDSYGKDQGANAPVGEVATFQYATALNALLDDMSHRVRVGDTTCVFWTEAASPIEGLFSFMLSGDPSAQDEAKVQEIRGFLKRAVSGVAGAISDGDTPFYVLGLAPNASRLSIRFWLTGTVAEFAARLAKHAENLEIVRGPKDRELLTLRDLLDQTARERDGISPVLGGALARAVLSGAPYPESMLAAILNRVRIGGESWQSHPRAAYIKAHLIRNFNKEIPVALDENHSEHAYHLGRLFAALEKAQQDALPGINATIKDRYFGAASSTPASVFPRLIRMSQHHLGKLDGGIKVNAEKRVQAICDKLTGFPAHMGLADQGLFAIGYYHQRADFFKKKEVSPDA